MKHAAIKPPLTGTKFPKRVVDPDTVPLLKPGTYNQKLGGVVTKGALAGASMWSLSLEERKTCPTYCKMWDACYGNNMQWAQRIDHTSPRFLPKLSAELDTICSRFPLVLVRLHVLGDFYDEDYVVFWHDKLRTLKNLHVFGYTAHSIISEIGQRIYGNTVIHGWSRWAVRFSGLKRAQYGAVVMKPGETTPFETFGCPEQAGTVKSCAECGACWNWNKTVRFDLH